MDGEGLYFEILFLIYLFGRPLFLCCIDEEMCHAESTLPLCWFSSSPVTVLACLPHLVLPSPALGGGQTAACKQIGNCQGPFNCAERSQSPVYYWRRRVPVMWSVGGFLTSLTAATESELSGASFGQSSKPGMDSCPLRHYCGCWHFRVCVELSNW